MLLEGLPCGFAWPVVFCWPVAFCCPVGFVPWGFVPWGLVPWGFVVFLLKRFTPPVAAVVVVDVFPDVNPAPMPPVVV